MTRCLALLFATLLSWGAPAQPAPPVAVHAIAPADDPARQALDAWLEAFNANDGSVAKIVKLEHAWRRLDGRNDDGFQVAPFPG